MIDQQDHFSDLPIETRTIGDATNSGAENFLADAGCKNPREMRAKILLADTIRSHIEARGLRQDEVAEMIGVAQPDISKITRGMVKGFSVWKLAKILTDLGATTEIVVHMPNGRNELITIS
jgi:predicted XRE-type DNA-binding protein